MDIPTGHSSGKVRHQLGRKEWHFTPEKEQFQELINSSKLPWNPCPSWGCVNFWPQLYAAKQPALLISEEQKNFSLSLIFIVSKKLVSSATRCVFVWSESLGVDSLRNLYKMCEVFFIRTPDSLQRSVCFYCCLQLPLKQQWRAINSYSATHNNLSFPFYKFGSQSLVLSFVFLTSILFHITCYEWTDIDFMVQDVQLLWDRPPRCRRQLRNDCFNKRFYSA